VNEDSSDVGRWKEYVASYVLRHPTERLPRSFAEKQERRTPVFLKR
jgi:paired amphipathic helix protein Sin3a